MQLRRMRLRLKQPFASSYGSVAERELLTVALTDCDGVTGWGEAAPLPAYDGVTPRRVERALESYRPALQASAISDSAGLLEACRRIDDLPQALAAIDVALWDLAARRQGKPVCALLVDAPLDSVPVNATISASDANVAAQQAAQARCEGFTCLKVKVGVGGDIARLRAVRAAAGPAVALRIDANGAWNVQQAVQAIGELEPVGLELVEEPSHGVRAIREVREQVAARVAIDETAAEPGALGGGAADAVCLKISRCGGISGLLAAASVALAAGTEVYVASTLDGPLGVAAGLHAAAALAAHRPMPPCGLATLDLFADLDNPLPVRSGRIAVPQTGGLGVSVGDG